MRKLYLLLALAITINVQAQTNFALTFNGTSHLVNIGVPLPQGSAYTKEAWVYLTTSSGARNIISSLDVPFWVDNGVLKAGQSSVYDFVSDATMPLNRWVHVAVTSGAGVMKLYRDGKLVSTSNNPGIGNYQAQTTYIGSHQGSGSYWQGAIDEVRIWKAVLTEEQIKNNMLKSPAANATDLAAYYNFNAGSGNVLANLSTNGLGANGTITGATWTASPVTYNPNALAFDGVDDYVNIGSSSALKPTTALTHEVWIKAANFSVAGIVQVTSNFENGGYGIGLVGNNIQWELKSSSNPTGYLTVTYPASNLVNNQWYHIAGTFDGSYMRLYVDGVQVSSLSLGGTGRTIIYNNPGNSMLIGAEASAGTAPVAGHYFQGQVDEVRIWNVLRTPVQILASAKKELNVNVAGETTGLVAYYNFNQGITNGTNDHFTGITDVKGSHNGMLSNFAMTGTTSNFVTGPPSLILLPVEWKSFTVRSQEKKAVLQWSTAREVNTSEFIVQHSIDGRSFSNIGRVAANINASLEKTYSYLHTSPVSGTNYYRLAQKDIDGKSGYSEIRKLEIGEFAKAFEVHNTLVSGANLRITVNQPLTLSLFTSTGKLIFTKRFSVGTHDVNMSSYATGAYWLTAKGQTEKVIVQ